MLTYQTVPIIVRVSRDNGQTITLNILKVTSASARPSPPEAKPIARWNGHVFTVSPSLIRGFTDLKIKGSCETNEKNKNKQKYYVRKYGNAREVSMTIGLNAYLGIADVRSEAIAFVDEAIAGKSDYFYLGETKLFSSSMRLISADIAEIAHFPGKGDVWVSCKINVTFKQGTKNEGGEDTEEDESKSKKKKASAKKSSSKKKSSSTKKSSTSSKKKVTNKSTGREIIDSWSQSTKNERKKQLTQAKAKAKETAANAKAASQAAKKGMISK